MTRVAIITTHGQDSSKQLCDGLLEAGIAARVVDLKKQNYNGDDDYTFSYGTSIPSKRVRKRYNSPEAVKVCVDKAATFRALQKASIPIPEWTTDSAVAEQWDIVCCRKTSSGRKNDGLEWWKKEWEATNIPECELYTKHVEHVREYRVVVFMEEVGIYYKALVNGVWELRFVKPSQWRSSHEDMGWYAVEAAKAIGIDYVGFDVLVNSKGQCTFLEANSSPILCPEIKDAIINHFVEL